MDTGTRNWYGDVAPMTPADWENFDEFRRRHSSAIRSDFEYDLEEIVQMQGVGMLRLRSALNRMPDRIAVTAMLFRDIGKAPSFFDGAQIEALLARHRDELNAGNPEGHREADELDV